MKTEDRKTMQLVPHNESPQLPDVPANPCNIFADPDSAGVAWTTLDPSNPEHVYLIQQIGAEGATTIDKWIGKQFVAVHMHVCKWSLVEEDTGEYKDGLRITLVGRKGELLTFAGESARRGLQRLCSIPCIGLPPWPDGLTLDVAQVTDGKKRRHVLTVPQDVLAKLIDRHSAMNTRRK